MIVNIGKDFGLTHCGAHTMDTMRMESGFLHWGHDISPEENQYQAGLAFTISNKKDVDFIGKQALEKIKTKHPRWRYWIKVLPGSFIRIIPVLVLLPLLSFYIFSFESIMRCK